MLKRDTKNVILDKALDLFSIYGYEGVSVADIAGGIGIKASSLYKHFASKREIYNAVLAKAGGGYGEIPGLFGTGGPDADDGVAGSFNTDAFVRSGTALFKFLLHDDTARKLRRMMIIEQYGDAGASSLFTGQYIDAPLLCHGSLFKNFMDSGVMKRSDADVAAAHFYAPVYLMLCLCDNCPEREAESLEFIKQHIIQFCNIYASVGGGNISGGGDNVNKAKNDGPLG